MRTAIGAVSPPWGSPPASGVPAGSTGFGADGSVHRQGTRAGVDGPVLVDGTDQGIEVLEIGSIFLQVLGPLVGRHVLLHEGLDQTADRGDVDEAHREVLGADAV